MRKEGEKLGESKERKRICSFWEMSGDQLQFVEDLMTSSSS